MRVATARAWLANRLAGETRRLIYRGTLIWTRLGDRFGIGGHQVADRTIAAELRPADGWARWWTTLIVSMALLVVVAVSGFILIRGLNALTRPDVERAAPSASLQAGEDDGSVQAREGGYVGDDTVPPGTPSQGTEGQLPDVNVYVNRQSGYLFSYPTAWNIVQIEGTDRLVDPAGDVQIMFDVAPTGPLQTASERVVEQTTRGFSNVELIESQVETTPQGLPSLVVGVNGIGPDGETFRFLVITVQGPDGNRAITVRFSPEADPRGALPVIQQVVSSFRVSSPA
jgi:hypothetical protein